MRRHQQNILDRAAKVVNTTVVDMFNKIVDRTPVGNPSLWKYPAPKGYNPGTLKASWGIDYNTNGAIRNDKGQFATPNTVGGISFRVNSPSRQDATIYNIQPYAQRVETGWSTQAPAGMMRITIKEYVSILDKNAMKYRIR